MAITSSRLNLNTTVSASPKLESTTSNLSALEKEKLGGENVGEVLNKMVDPNWTDSGKKLRTTGNANLDKDAFFKLMLAQMKNQDPSNPMKSHEMAAQLANFSSLEQMQNMNKTLEEMKNGQKPTESFQALNLIGKSVAGDSSKIVRGPNDKDHDFRFNLPSDASDVNVRVIDSEGNSVRTYNLRGLRKGENKITWNGEDEQAMKAAPGEYRFAAEAKTADGGKLAIKTEFDGLITGVSYSPSGPILHVGNQAIRFGDVKKITDPRLMSNDQKVNEGTNLDLKRNSATGQNGQMGSVVSPKTTTAKASTAKSNLMTGVDMTPDMKAKIAKEMK